MAISGASSGVLILRLCMCYARVQMSHCDLALTMSFGMSGESPHSPMTCKAGTLMPAGQRRGGGLVGAMVAAGGVHDTTHGRIA